jgi:hypothetical protein
VELLGALGEPLDQRPVVQPDDLGRPGARIHRSPADPQALGERRPLGRQVQVIGGHRVGVQAVTVQGGPAPVGAVGGVLHQHVGVELRITGAALAMLERHRQHTVGDLVAVGAVVVAPHPDPVALQVGDAHLQSFGAGLGDLPAGLVAAAGGQQRHALGGAEAVVEGLHPLVDPLPLVLPRPVERLPVQLARVEAEDLATEPLDRLHLDPLGAASPAGGLDDAYVALELLGRRERLQALDALLGGPLLERLQQRPGGQLGARVGAPQRRTPDLAGGGVQALEHGPHLIGGGDPFEAACLRGAADEAAWGLSASGEVLFAVAGDLVQPVGLLARLQRLDGSATSPTLLPAPRGQPCIADADV